jgi:hypothetical protein
MPSAIDVFREQREAAEQLHARVQEISALLEQLRPPGQLARAER